jgi:hypothetical protein
MLSVKFGHGYLTGFFRKVFVFVSSSEGFVGEVCLHGLRCLLWWREILLLLAALSQSIHECFDKSKRLLEM